MDPEAVRLYLVHHGYGQEGEDVLDMAQRWAADRPTDALRRAGVMKGGGINAKLLLPAIMQEMQTVRSAAPPETSDNSGAKGIAAIADDIIPAIARGIK